MHCLLPVFIGCFVFEYCDKHPQLEYLFAKICMSTLQERDTACGMDSNSCLAHSVGTPAGVSSAVGVCHQNFHWDNLVLTDVDITNFLKLKSLVVCLELGINAVWNAFF
jgi:hypothetical protein